MTDPGAEESAPGFCMHKYRLSLEKKGLQTHMKYAILTCVW